MGGLGRSKRGLHAVIGFTCFALVQPACGSGSDNGALGDANVLTSAGAGGSGGSMGGGGAASDGERFLAEYGSAVCALYEPCCNREGLGFNAAGCTDWFAKVTAAYLPDEFRPEPAAECLLALAAARAQDPDRCSNVASFDEATFRSQCDEAFVAPARDGAPLLGACMLAGDCAAGSDDKVTCYGRACVRQRRGTSGDGPCYAGGDVGVAAEMFTCDAADGVYCHRADNRCAARVGDGERCPYTNACDDTSMCVGGLCRAFPDRGEPCLNAIPGAGGYCDADSSCDVATLTCGPGLDIGGVCSDTRKCASGVCIDGACAPSDWQRNLNCAGRATP